MTLAGLDQRFILKPTRPLNKRVDRWQPAVVASWRDHCRRVTPVLAGPPLRETHRDVDNGRASSVLSRRRSLGHRRLRSARRRCVVGASPSPCLSLAAKPGGGRQQDRRRAYRSWVRTAATVTLPRMPASALRDESIGSQLRIRTTCSGFSRRAADRPDQACASGRVANLTAGWARHWLRSGPESRRRGDSPLTGRRAANRSRLHLPGSRSP